jgi:hypothetical protein
MFAKISIAGVTAGAVRAVVLVIALIAMAASTHAQPNQPSANAVKIAREILDLKKSVDLFGSMVPGVIERVKGMLVQTNPTLGKDLDAVAAGLRRTFAPRTADLMNNIARLYASRFTETELKEIVAFYRTPTGKKVIAFEPDVFEDAVADLKVWQEKFSEEVFARFRAEMKKRGHNL